MSSRPAMRSRASGGGRALGPGEGFVEGAVYEEAVVVGPLRHGPQDIGPIIGVAGGGGGRSEGALELGVDGGASLRERLGEMSEGRRVERGLGGARDAVAPEAPIVACLGGGPVRQQLVCGRAGHPLGGVTNRPP